MRFLLINVCGAEGVLGLGTEDGVVAQETLPGRASSEQVATVMRRLFASAGWTVGEVTGVGVVIGPGSFTGVRVGLALAKGICEGVGVGMVAMSRLTLLGDGVALLDAGRREYFCRVDGVERLLRRDELPELTEGVTCEAGVAKALGVRLVEEPGAGVMLAEALRRVSLREWSDVGAVDANYLRRTDAEVLVQG